MSVTLEDDTIRAYLQASAKPEIYARSEIAEVFAITRDAVIAEIDLRLAPTADTGVQDNARHKLLALQLIMLYLANIEVGADDPDGAGFVTQRDRLFISHGWHPDML